MEAQEGDGDGLLPFDVGRDGRQGAVDHVGLDESCGDDDDDRLQEERGDERAATEGSQEAVEAREEDRAKDEANDGNEGFGPTVRFVGRVARGAAEANEDGVTGLH